MKSRPAAVTGSFLRTNQNVGRIQDRRLTVRMVGGTLNSPHTTVNQIFTNQLGMRKIGAKIIPKNSNNPHFLVCVITGNES